VNIYCCRRGNETFFKLFVVIVINKQTALSQKRCNIATWWHN